MKNSKLNPSRLGSQSGAETQNSKLIRGFTLIEILIASFIFSVVVLMSLVIFSDTIGSKTRSEVLQNAQENLTIPMEVISRDIREADWFGLNENNCDGLIIKKTDRITSAKETTCYYRQDSGNGGVLKSKKLNGINWGVASDLTSLTDVSIESLNFEINKPELATKTQPFVEISVGLKTKASLRKNIEEVKLTVRTAVTMRKINWK